MEKKQVKHFVQNKNSYGNGIPACGVFTGQGFKGYAITTFGEIAKTRRGVTCGRCRNTVVFRG